MFCLQAVVLSRHGIRYPGKNDLVNMAEILSSFWEHGIDPDVYDRLSASLEKFPLSNASALAPSGAVEQQNLGFSLRAPPGAAFRHHRDVRFVSSTTPRAVDSRLNFEAGFSRAVGWNATAADNETRDDLLRFFDVCPRYRVEVKNNKSAFVEYNKFLVRITRSLCWDSEQCIM